MPRLSLAKLERHLYTAADRLRQEGLDAATYKDYILGMLFLKRCSDVFDAEREKLISSKVQQGMALEDAQTLYGENPDFYDASAWSICRLNMLLHGVPGADIQLADTLLHPMHREAGELERFDRVIANPPFSQNYTRSNMEFPERFRWGWCPTTGKKADLMFAQHMLAVCKPGGIVATVMPHGVLFRGGAEKDIRKKFLEQDLIEAVILDSMVNLLSQFFHSTQISVCLWFCGKNDTLYSRTVRICSMAKRK